MSVSRWIAILSLVGCLTAPAIAQATEDIALLAGLEGRWTGQLTYRDYRSDQRVELPANLEIQISPDGQYLIAHNAFTDPGYVVRSLDVSTFDPALGNLVSYVFSSGSTDREELRVASRDVESPDRWTLVFEAEGQDDDRPAMIRITRSLADGRFVSTKEIRYEDESEWVFRNELEVERPVLDANDLVGTWRVDLRPTPDADPYYQDFVIRSVDGNTFEGTFYGTDLQNGRVNLDWNDVVFSFFTEDGTGTYNTSGKLVDGRLEGLTHSLGREFLAVWTAEKQ